MGVQTCNAAGSWNACQCGTPDGDSGAPDAGMVDAFVDPTVDAFAPRDAGMERSTSMMVGPAGGELTLEGATLTVPAGALTTTTELRMIATTIPGPAGYTLYSPVFRFEPAGTTFAMPATIRMPYTGNRARAALFWSQADGHWERIGGVPDATHVVGQVSHFSDGFAADGVDYREAPGATCSVTRAWANSTMRPSALGIVFTASDCDGRPVTGLTAADVEIREDDLLLGSETPLTLEAVNNPEIVINLAFDMSASTAPLLPDVIAGAQAFIDRLRMVRARPQVSVWVFDGSAGSAWQPFTRDLDLVRTRIGQLGMYVPADPASTNLFEGTLNSINQLTGRFMGFSVVFTDGADTTRAIPEANVINAIRMNPVISYGVGLRSRDYDGAALRRIAPDGVIDAPDRATLPREMARVAAMIDDVVLSTYTARYCTPKRAGMHTVAMGVGASSEHRTEVPGVSLDATGFVAGCTAASLAAACDHATCGGLFCGTCAEDTVCTTPIWGQPYFAPANECRPYPGDCGDNGQELCGGACVSLDYNTTHCGACDHTCGAGQTCFAGACVERASLTIAAAPSGTSLSTAEGTISGTLYVTAYTPTGGGTTLWRSPRREGATPQLIGTDLAFGFESPTHAYIRSSTDDTLFRMRLGSGATTLEAVPMGVPLGCSTEDWVSADEVRCYSPEGIERFNVMTGARSVDVPAARWSSVGSASFTSAGGIYVRAPDGALFWYPVGGEFQYTGLSEAAVSTDASGRLIFRNTAFRGSSAVFDPSSGRTFVGLVEVPWAMNSLKGSPRGWFAYDGFWSFANGENGRPTPCTGGSTARGCLYAPPEFSRTISFDVHVCEHGETCPGSDVCCPNPTGNDFCAPSCS